ncbi:hypothetical protein K0M31_010471 [Melipona bicolor]|uniref:Uncharacterized protein n=1 Tax=Melipona bicolor TaxID=60889 RepID=A0AA40FL60_9HYME|nr:hypothetical protein K0M31_010471 [Melipona bicolor]
MIEFLIAVLLTINIIANCYIGTVCCLDQKDWRKKISPSPSQNDVSSVSDGKRSSLNSGETKRMKQVVQQTEPETVSVKLPPDRCRSPIWSNRMKNQLDSITNSTSEVCKNIKIIETQAEVHATKCTSTNDFAESRHDDHFSTQSYLIHEKTKSSKLKNLKIVGIRTFQSVYSRRKDSKANESGRRKNQTLNVPVQKSGCISPISRSATGIYNVSTSSKISTNLGATNIEASNDNKTAEDTELGKQLQNNSSKKPICDLTIHNEPSSTTNQTLDESRTVSIRTTKEGIVISIKLSGPENGVVVSQTRDESPFCECPLVKSFNNFLGTFKDCFVKLRQSQEASKDPPPRIRVTDHSRTLNNSQNETSYMKLPGNAGRSVGNK